MLNAAQQNTETHQAWLLDDGEGNFTGAVIPMLSELASIDQWQATFDTIFAEAVVIDPSADINGMYVVTFQRDERPEHNGLLITRLRSDIQSGYDSRLPVGALGLIAVSTDPNGTRIAIAALSGGVSLDGALRPNRILCSIIDDAGKSLKDPLSKNERLAIKAIGRLLLTRLDRHMEAARG